MQHKLGGYETWLSANRVQEDGSVILTNSLLEMLAELRKGTTENEITEVWPIGSLRRVTN